MNRWGAALAAAVLSVGVFLAATELTMRGVDPPPRLQVVRPTHQLHHTFGLLHGEPVWSVPGTAERVQADCEAPRHAVLLGSSIFFGTGFGPEESIGMAAQRALDGAAPSAWCVHNLAQSAFTSGAKLAMAREWVPRLEPEVVVWELWNNDPGGYTMIDGVAYNLHGIVVDADGWPAPPMDVPATLHHTLFRWSHAWWYATLAGVQRVRGGTDAGWAALAERTLPEVDALVRAHGGRLIVLEAPPLNQPFEASAAEPYEGYRRVRTWAESAGVQVVSLASRLKGADHEALRLDTCCHYNARGQARVGAVIADLVRDVRAPSAPEPPPPEPPPAPPGR